MAAETRLERKLKRRLQNFYWTWIKIIIMILLAITSYMHHNRWKMPDEFLHLFLSLARKQEPGIEETLWELLWGSCQCFLFRKGPVPLTSTPKTFDGFGLSWGFQTKPGRNSTTSLRQDFTLSVGKRDYFRGGWTQKTCSAYSIWPSLPYYKKEPYLNPISARAWPLLSTQIGPKRLPDRRSVFHIPAGGQNPACKSPPSIWKYCKLRGISRYIHQERRVHA